MDPRYISDTSYFNSAYVQTGLTPYLNGTMHDQNVFDSEYAAHSMEHNDFSAQAMSLPTLGANSSSDVSDTSHDTHLLGHSDRMNSSSSSASSQSPIASTKENPTKTFHRGAGDAIESTIPEEQAECMDPSNSAKRSKFLERNRLAAAKCRTKKKRWTNNLEAAARQASQQTRELHAIVQNLRDEVLQYKTELMNHQNCECHEIQSYLFNEHSQGSFQDSNSGTANGQ